MLFLVACGGTKIHENVDESVAKDSMQVMDRIIYNIDKGISIEEVSEEDNSLFERYFDKYIEGEDIFSPKLEGVDYDIYIMASGSLVTYAKGASLESDKESIKENNDLMMKLIKTGKAAGE